MRVHDLHPYLHVHDAGRAIDFYEKAFGAKELMRLVDPPGALGMRNSASTVPR